MKQNNYSFITTITINKKMYTLLSTRITTKSHCNAVKSISNDKLCIHTTSVPEHGKANQCIIKVLSDFLGIPKSKIDLHSGSKCRDKIFIIDSEINKDFVVARLGEQK